MIGKHRSSIFIPLLVLILLFTSACSGQITAGENAGADQPEALTVLSTTTLVADVVAQVAGDRVNQSTLIPAGVDEHGFQPSPQDIAKASDADVVFMNGAGLEEFTERLLQNAGGNRRVIEVSDGITLLESAEAHEEEGEEEHEGEEGHEGDPHTWTDPNNVIIWVNNVEQALVDADPDNADYYRENADRYRLQLKELDAWVVEQVNQIPQEKRMLVTDHTVFTYFADRYGFEQVGAVIPGYSTLSQPSAQDLAELQDTIRALQVPAIFVGNSVNPALSERIAQDTQTRLVPVLTGSLTEEDGPAPTYIDYIRYNVNAIVGALK